MKKQELIKRTALECGLTNSLAKNVIDSIFKNISAELIKGTNVNITGFGKFTPSKRKARIARNPKTGNMVKVGERTSIKFKISKTLKDLLK